MHTLNSLRKAASVHNCDVRHRKMVRVSQRKDALLTDMKRKFVTLPTPRAPTVAKNRKSAMFKTTEHRRVMVRKSTGVK